MPGHLLEQGTGSETLLQKLASRETIILADTLHLETLSMNDPDGTMLSLQAILQAVAEKNLDYHVWAATKIVLDRWHKEKSATNATRTRKEHVLRVLEQLFVELGMEMRARVPGPHISLIDPRIHNDAEALVASVQRTYALFKEKGVQKKDIMVSIPATEDGMHATKRLQSMDYKNKINLYLVSSLKHAEACVAANSTMITVPVGPVLKSFEDKQQGIRNMSSCQGGIEEIQSMFEYLNRTEIRTRAIATSFRNMSEVGQLSECFAVCVSPEQVERLKGGARVPIALVKGPNNIDKQRGQDANPINMLTRGGALGFSGTTRSAINSVLFHGLQTMKRQMDIIEQYVELEFVRQFEFHALDLSKFYDLHQEVRNILLWRAPKNTTKSNSTRLRITFQGTPKGPTTGSPSANTQSKNGRGEAGNLKEVSREWCYRAPAEEEDDDEVDEVF